MTEVQEKRAALRKEKVAARNALSEEERVTKSKTIVERLLVIAQKELKNELPTKEEFDEMVKASEENGVLFTINQNN